MTATPHRHDVSDSVVPREDRNLWAAIPADDVRALRAWLGGLGFEQGILVPGEPAERVRHSEMLWPEGGRVMVHSRERADDLAGPGPHAVYVVTRDPDTVHARALAAGAEFLRPMKEEDYGSRGFTIRDPEGNAWSFGTYAGVVTDRP